MSKREEKKFVFRRKILGLRSGELKSTRVKDKFQLFLMFVFRKNKQLRYAARVEKYWDQDEFMLFKLKHF